MSSARRSFLAGAVVIGFGFVAGIIAPQALAASTVDRLVIDAHTGLAISGFDPVAYFSVKKAEPGLAEFELTQNGTVWRFRNEGNRTAFAENPEVYTPRFGGYDPMAVVRGVSVPGHPQIWAVVGERLYLFYDEKARADFLANPGLVIERAMRKWPEIARTIGR